jgi:isocitrate dehydrogenase (NAD+)
MSDYLGETEMSDAIFKATEIVINEGKYVTYDLGGNASTSRMADKISLCADKFLKR